MTVNRAVTPEDRESAYRAAQALNAYYEEKGVSINARVCPRTAAVISDLSKPESIPEPEIKWLPNPDRPKSIAARVQEYLEKHKGKWFRPLYISAAIDAEKANVHTALSSLHSAGIVKRRTAEEVGGRAVEYSIAGEAS